jgi:ribosome-associated protein
METFQIQGDYIELTKFLKALKVVGSGGEAKLLIEDGMVKLNNETEHRKRAKLRHGDVVAVEGREVKIIA